jgi:hypothetical protein
MASLQSYVSMLPGAFQSRYSTSGHFLLWGKELLEEIQERGFLSALKKESGCVVLKNRWIDKPADFLELVKIYNPDDEKQEYRVEDVEGKFKLQDWEIEEESGSVDTNAYDTYATTGVRCTDLVSPTLYPADYFKNYLFFIESGTLANTGLVVFSNTIATAAGVPLTFLHTLSSVLSGTKVTGARLIPPQYYVMMKYRGTITPPTAIDDEFPIPTDCELRLVPAWLRWCCERQAMATSNETKYWEAQKEKILNDIQFSRSGRLISPARGRRLVGFEKGYRVDKKHPDWSEFS